MDKFLTNREYAGVIKEGEDPQNRGRYKVFINELMYYVEDSEEDPGIFCVNHVHKYRDTHSSAGIYGQYFPLQVGTRVIVKFYEEDLTTGYIDRIISDYHSELDVSEVSCAPFENTISDRDQYYQLLRTVAEDLVAVSCDTENFPKNGIHIYHKKDNVVFVFDENGVHLYAKQNLDVNIDQKAVINIGKNMQLIVGDKLDIIVSGDINITTNANYNLGISSDCNISVSGNCKLGVDGDANINVSGLCNVDGQLINLNCGLSSKPVLSEISKEEIPKAETAKFNEVKEIKVEI